MNFDSQPQIALNDIVQFPLPGQNVPGSVTFSPNGRYLLYLFSPDGDLVRHLYRFDLENGEQRLLIAPPATMKKLFR